MSFVPLTEGSEKMVVAGMPPDMSCYNHQRAGGHSSVIRVLAVQANLTAVFSLIQLITSNISVFPKCLNQSILIHSPLAARVV